ncbi:MAG: YlxR family protein [Caldisericia bacterium]
MPERTCVCCNRKKERTEMIRVSANFEPDYQMKATGRGFYVCREESCVLKLASGKTSIARSLKTKKIAKIELLRLSNNLAESLFGLRSLVKVMNVKDKNR